MIPIPLDRDRCASAGFRLALPYQASGVPACIDAVSIVNIKSVSQLRALLLEMETALGLVELSPNERDVLYAINEVSAGVLKAARSEAIRSHPLAAAIPQATYHRALKSLVQRGLVQHAPDTKAGAYLVTRNIGEAEQA